MAVTRWLQEPMGQAQILLFQKKGDVEGEPLLPSGLIFSTDIVLEHGDDFWGAEKSHFIVNVNDLINTITGGIRNGCCGVDGGDGPNLFCKNNHPIATEVSDCYQPEFVHMAKEHIALESYVDDEQGTGSLPVTKKKHRSQNRGRGKVPAHPPAGRRKKLKKKRRRK